MTRNTGIIKSQGNTFDVLASSFAANMSVKRNALDHKPDYPKAADVVETSFYVDNCLTRAEAVAEAVDLHQQLVALFAKGGFVSVCGILVIPMDHTEPELRDVQPTHLIPPTIIKAKILLQRVWGTRIGWDDLLPESIYQDCMTWRSELPLLTKKNIVATTHGMLESRTLTFTASLMHQRMPTQLQCTRVFRTRVEQYTHHYCIWFVTWESSEVQNFRGKSSLPYQFRQVAVIM